MRRYPQHMKIWKTDKLSFKFIYSCQLPMCKAFERGYTHTGTLIQSHFQSKCLLNLISWHKKYQTAVNWFSSTFF